MVALTADDPRPPAPELPGGPWIETRAGGLFFLNALFVSPFFIVLLPALLTTFLRSFGVLGADWSVLDTFPTLAGIVIPYVGWLALGPAWLVLRNLRMAVPRPARRALGIFLLAHLSTFGWFVASWIAKGTG